MRNVFRNLFLGALLAVCAGYGASVASAQDYRFAGGCPTGGCQNCGGFRFSGSGHNGGRHFGGGHFGNGGHFGGGQGHQYGMRGVPHHFSREYLGPPGPQAAQVAYPYYTTRGPRDYFANEPWSIGY